MTLNWTWRKGTDPAARITTSHVISVADIQHVLGWHASREFCLSDGDTLPELSRTAIEDITREALRVHGSSLMESVWSDDYPEDECDEIEAWALAQVNRVWPKQAKAVSAL